jgi:hypothetical protein
VRTLGVGAGGRRLWRQRSRLEFAVADRAVAESGAIDAESTTRPGSFTLAGPIRVRYHPEQSALVRPGQGRRVRVQSDDRIWLRLDSGE